MRNTREPDWPYTALRMTLPAATNIATATMAATAPVIGSTPIMESSMRSPHTAVIASPPTSRNTVCAWANIPYAHAELAGLPGSVPFFERSTVQWENTKQPTKNSSSAMGNAATAGLFAATSVTAPERSTCMGIWAGMTG